MTTPRHGKTEASAVVSALVRSWGGDVRHVGVDPDRPCPHEDFVARVEVNRITASDDDPTIVAYSASVWIRCAQCDEQFRFTGVQAGDMPSRPMCSVDETELRAPIRPATADPDFGMGLPGYSVTYREGGGGTYREGVG